MNKYQRKIECKQHKIAYCCGYGPPYSCDKCIEEGWVTMGGDGGGTRAKNEKTNEYRDHEYWRQRDEIRVPCKASKAILRWCDDWDISPKGATLVKIRKYMGSNYEASEEKFWCYEWAGMYDDGCYGVSSDYRLTRLFEDGHVEWSWNNRLHRDGGPAVIDNDGEEKFFRNGKETNSEGQDLPGRGPVTVY